MNTINYNNKKYSLSHFLLKKQYIKISYYLNLILLKKIQHIIHIQNNHQNLNSKTTLYTKTLPIHHTNNNKNTQTTNPILNLLNQPNYHSQNNNNPFK